MKKKIMRYLIFFYFITVQVCVVMYVYMFFLFFYPLVCVVKKFTFIQLTNSIYCLGFKPTGSSTLLACPKSAKFSIQFSIFNLDFNNW
jgi:hypothetical protein